MNDEITKRRRAVETRYRHVVAQVVTLKHADAGQPMTRSKISEKKAWRSRFRLPRTRIKRSVVAAVFMLGVIGFGILLQSMLLRPVFATSATNYPTATGTNSWTSPTNADANDTNNATAAPGRNATVNGIWKTFGFGTLPSNAIINSVAINTRYMISATNTFTQLNAQAFEAGAGCGTAQSDTSRPTVMTVKTFDVTSCRTWAVADLNDTNFSVQIGAQKGATNTAYTFSMDYVSVTVGYTIPTTFNQASYRIFNNQDASIALSPSFAATTDYTTGTNPESVAYADFNGDGKLDLVTANNGANTVSILLGTGTGSFGAKTDFTTGSCPDAISSADFNGDGHPDLAVANLCSNTVSILLGTGTGSFGAKTDFTIPSGPASVTTADFNNDGKLDLAVGNGGNVSILLGTGTGSFGANTDFVADSGATALATADFNNDGNVDLAAVGQGVNVVSILLGTGTGSFGANTDFIDGGTGNGVTTGDFNGDGNMDVAAIGQSTNVVSILLGTGTGSFGTKTDFTTGTVPYSVTTADFNGDGKLDLAVVNQSASTVSILAGTGTGSFGAKTDFTTGVSPYSVTTADFNGDGKLDLAVANHNPNTASVLLNTSSAPLDTGTPLAALNTSAAVPGDGQAFRVRLDLNVSGASLSAKGQSFKLQYGSNGSTACSTPPSTWNDVTDTSTVGYYDNPNASNGMAFSTSTANDVADGTNTIIHESYQEKGTTTFTDPTAIHIGQDGMWDFALTTNQSLQNTHYCLRVTSSTGTPLNTYTNYPDLVTPSATYRQGAYRWLKNSGSTAFTQASSNPSTSGDSIARGVQYDTNGNMYTAGFCSAQTDWCVEKRSSSTGSLSYAVNETGFTNGGQGVYGLAIDQANNAMFVVGYDSNAGSADHEWRIEKRALSTGALVSGFGTGGIITENISANAEEATGVSIDPSGGFLYVIGMDASGTTGKWRIEKRATSTGALSYGVSETLTANTCYPLAIKIDTAGGFAYMVGYDQMQSVPTVNEWRIEKRTLSNGALVTSFGTSGGISESISGGSGVDEAYDVALDTGGGNIYVVGSDNNAGSALEWRMEKRSASTGALVSGFGTGGAISEHVSLASDEAYTAQVDPTGGYLYVGGYDESPSGNYQEWRLEKRSVTDGSLAGGFGTSGAVTERISTSNDALYASAIDVSNGAIYLVGFDMSSGVWDGWRTEKRNTADGSLFNGINMSPLAGQNQALDVSPATATLHLRVDVGAIGSGVAASGKTFKLQYAYKAGSCSASSYTDVTASTPIQWYDDTGITGGATVPSSSYDPVDGSNSNTYQTFQEANTFANSSAMYVGQDGLWDFSLVLASGTSTGTDICLRVSDSAGNPLSSYTVYPEIQYGPAAGQRLRMGKWFDSNAALQPYFMAR